MKQKPPKLITLEERKLIEKYLKEGYPPYMIAKFLGRRRNVIAGEIKRNSVNGVYNAEIAHKLFLERFKNRFYKGHPEYRRPDDILVDDELIIKTFSPCKINLNTNEMKSIKRMAQRIFFERVNVLNELFGNENWKKYPKLLLYRPESLRKRAENLSKALGSLWKDLPYLLIKNEDALLKRLLLLKKLFVGDDRELLKKTPLLILPIEKILYVYKRTKIEYPDEAHNPSVFLRCYKKLKKQNLL
mgnify:CR=1 FL=1